MSADRAAQNAVRDQLVAAVLAERPRRRRRRTITLAVVAALLGATAVAEATRLIGVGEPVERLIPRSEQEQLERYRAPHGATVAVTLPDPDYRYGWGASYYTTAKGEDCVLAGNVLGNQLGLQRGERFHPYGPEVIGACGDLQRLGLMSDTLRMTGEHPRTLLFGRTTTPGRPPVYRYRGRPHRATVGPGGTFLVVFDGVLESEAITLEPGATP